MLPADYSDIKVPWPLVEVMEIIFGRFPYPTDGWKFQRRPSRNGHMIVLLCGFGSDIPEYYGEWPSSVFFHVAKKISIADLTRFRDEMVVEEGVSWDNHPLCLLQALSALISSSDGFRHRGMTAEKFIERSEVQPYEFLGGTLWCSSEDFDEIRAKAQAGTWDGVEVFETLSDEAFGELVSKNIKGVFSKKP